MNQAKELKGSPHRHVRSFPFLPFPNDQIRRRCHRRHPDQELGVFKRIKGHVSWTGPDVKTIVKKALPALPEEHASWILLVPCDAAS